MFRPRVQFLDPALIPNLLDEAFAILENPGVIFQWTPALELLADVVEQDIGEVRAALEPALRRDVLVTEGADRVRFSHELMRGVLYDGMSAKQRRAWHEQNGGEVGPGHDARHGHAPVCRRTCRSGLVAGGIMGDCRWHRVVGPLTPPRCKLIVEG